MSVIGIDFGNESCFIAAGKAGGIETLANDYSLRATPACVAFAGKKRIIGVAAKNQQVTNMKNTIGNFKSLVGRKYKDPKVQKELQHIPYRCEERADGGIGVRVNYLDEEHVFSPEQLTAMLFTKLKETSESALAAQVNDCVLAVPISATNAERVALLDAANIAGFNVLRLMNETTAVALSYGFYKQDLPAENEKPRNVVFVDFGNANLQVSVVAFNKNKLKMLCSAWDQIGGRDFDVLLADRFAVDIKERYKVEARKNPRAWLRLLTEVEKIKKQMSANSTKLPLHIECFMDEIDVTSAMARTEMEELCAELLERTETVFEKCLADSKLSLDDIYAVEVVGGTTRIPAVKALLEKVFGKTVCTTLNQDEAVSRGCALQCAILSPAVRARDFAISDIQNYAVNVSWDGEGNQTGEMEVFSAFHAAPFSRLLTLFRREPFNLQISYADASVTPDAAIGRWHVQDVRPNAAGESQEVKIKVRINANGLVLISNATMVDKKEAEAQAAAAADEGGEGAEQQPMEQEDDPIGGGPTSQSAEEGGAGWTQRVKGWFSSTPAADGTDAKNKDKKKKATKSIELPLEAKTHGLSSTELQALIDEEWKMIKNDQNEKERVDVRNALEETIYELRDKLSEDGSLAAFVAAAARESICAQLSDLENWLYEDGEDCDREQYATKLSELRTVSAPIKARSSERELQPAEFSALGHAIQLAQKAVAEFRAGAVKYDHLTETEILNVSEAAEKAQKWHDQHIGALQATPKTDDLAVSHGEVRLQTQTLSACANSVLNRPKPTPPPADKAAPDAAGEKDAAGADGAEPTINDPMDVE